MPQATDSSGAVPQPVVTPLTRAAIFLVVTINPGTAAAAAVRAFCPDLAALVRAVGFRDQGGALTCVMAVGSAAWDRLFGQPRPADLHPFREIRAGARHAVATPGDLLDRAAAGWGVALAGDICYEEPMSSRAVALLRRIAARAGRLALLGDPGRAYLPREGLIERARYLVPTSRELEDREGREGVVYEVLPS